MASTNLPKLIVIVGPTATGKSALGVKLAQEFGGEIISADSRQVYRGLDIGTGKITSEEMAGIPHHLLDIADPQDQLSVVEWRKQADAAVADILARGQLPIIVGGTGFYIQAIVDNFTPPPVPPNSKLRQELDRLSLTELTDRLAQLDPDRLANIETKNPRRLIRAIEIAEYLGSVPNLVDLTSPPQYQVLLIGLDWPAEILKTKITKRLEARLAAGLIDEAKRLQAEGLSLERMTELGLEYRYLVKLLAKELTENQMVKSLTQAIWHYAKRQKTWFKKDRRIHWFRPDETKAIDHLVRKFIQSV